jgi:hypothetical protein
MHMPLNSSRLGPCFETTIVIAGPTIPPIVEDLRQSPDDQLADTLSQNQKTFVPRNSARSQSMTRLARNRPAPMRLPPREG